MRERAITVTVYLRSDGAEDAYGVPVVGFDGGTDVDYVLVAPGKTDDLGASRPDGVSVAYTLHFPRTYTGSLKGAEIVIPGDTARYHVLGDPKPYPQNAIPKGFPWNRKVEVSDAEG